MKILIVRGFPEKIHLNGYNSQELGLAHALRKKGHVCDIVYFNGREKDRIQEMDDGTKIFWMHGVNLLKNGLMPGVKRLIEEYDVIQVNEYDQMQSWKLYTFSRKPVVIYNGNYYSPFNREYNLKCCVFDHTFLNITGKKKKNIFCMTKSRPGQRFLEEKGFAHVTTVGVGLNVESLNKVEKYDADHPLSLESVRKKIRSDSFELLYVGKLEERRNIPFLLSAIRTAHEQEHSIHATLIGTGTEGYVASVRNEIRQMEEEKILRYYEKAAQNELPAFYEQADMFLLPTSYEIFGMVLLESMYYGCVPLTTMNGGSSVLIQDGQNGFIADLEEGKWVQTILSAARDRERLHEMSLKANAEIRDSFTWDKLADRFLEIYEKSMSSVGTSRNSL